MVQECNGIPGIPDLWRWLLGKALEHVLGKILRTEDITGVDRHFDEGLYSLDDCRRVGLIGNTSASGMTNIFDALALVAAVCFGQDLYLPISQMYSSCSKP